MANLDKVATSHNWLLGGLVVCFLTLRKQLAVNATKSYHVYKVKWIVVLHIYNKFWVSNYQDILQTKIKI